MAYKKLHIPDPCQQKWDKMAPMGEGRMCTSCNKIIVDFSELSDEELIQALQTKKPHCGKFSEEQMGTMFDLQQLLMKDQRGRKKYWSSVAAAIVAGMLQLSTAYGQNHNQHSQKLYPRKLAIEKYQLESTQQNTVAKEEKKLVNILVQRSDSQKGVSGILIKIKEIGVEGLTETGGTFMFEVTDQMDLNTWVTIKLENHSSGLRFARGYQPKKLRVKLNDLVNTTKIIYLEGKKLYKRTRMGVVAYGDAYGEHY